MMSVDGSVPINRVQPVPTAPAIRPIGDRQTDRDAKDQRDEQGKALVEVIDEEADEPDPEEAPIEEPHLDITT